MWHFRDDIWQSLQHAYKTSRVFTVDAEYSTVASACFYTKSWLVGVSCDGSEYLSTVSQAHKNVIEFVQHLLGPTQVLGTFNLLDNHFAVWKTF